MDFDLSMQNLGLGAGWYVVFLVSLTLHEAAHAWAAMKLGDLTAYHAGQVTLNPGPHVEREPLGTVLVPIISFLFSGWMIGWASAPYDPGWARHYPRRAALMALAGPTANLMLAVLAGIAIRAGLAGGLFVAPDEPSISQIAAAANPGLVSGLATLLSIAFMLNLLLLVFNLIPLPPLDGSAALGLVLSAEQNIRYQEFMSQPMFTMLGLLVAWRLFDRIFPPVVQFAFDVLYSGLL